jgi:hypothetical protein
MATNKSARIAAKIALGIAVATAISIGPGVALAAPTPTATISGTVSAAQTGVPLAGINVTLLDTQVKGGFGGPISGPGEVAITKTSATGTYRFTKVAPSDTTGYWVCFDGGLQGALAVYEGQCYSAAQGFEPLPDSFDLYQLPDDSLPIAVTSGQQVKGINAVMVDQDPSIITGVVTGKGVLGPNPKLKGVIVTAIDPQGATLGTATTTSDGVYTISGLPAVSTGYAVCFKVTSLNSLLYRDECYQHSAWKGHGAPPSGATLVQVSPNAATTASITIPL